MGKVNPLPAGPLPESAPGISPPVPRPRLSFTLSLKLSLFVSALLIFSLGAVLFSVWFFIRAGVRGTAVADNDSINYRVAEAAETALRQIRSNVSFLLGGGVPENPSSPETADYFFSQNPQVAAIVFLDGETGGSPRTLINRSFADAQGFDVSLIGAFLRLKGDEILESPGTSEARLFNGAPDFRGLPILALSFPYAGPRGFTGRALVLFSSESLIDYFGFGASPSIMVSPGGDVLIHPDSDVLSAGLNLGANPAIKGLSAGENHLTTRYRDEGGEVFASVHRLNFGGTMVLTTIRGDVVFESINATTRRNAYFALSVWFISLLLIRFFSLGLTRQLRTLKTAAEEIEEGRYHGSLPVKTRDETGFLTETMNSMSMALQNFDRFTNKEIARLTRRGLLAPGGVHKKAAFLFSDIRSFTAISASLSSAEVVEMLNGYMDLMVACVMVTGGVIDKFIGDAIVAHWGAVRPEQGDNLPSGEKEDALAALRAALLMRACLQCFNAERGGPKKPLIKNGCAVNSGTVIAGQIGTGERLEYTVIGEAVSLTERAEGFNKSFGTDILVSEHTYALAGGCLLCEEMPVIRGDTRLFAVVNLQDPGQIGRLFEELERIPKINKTLAERFVGAEGPRTLKELRFRLNISEPDLTKAAEDEKKFTVHQS
ncbi:MAG: adenylate/guanylate cyclase domain-containing protein [Spirochaetales bacterium]|jgi:adenylate cyclase|nr:adenylate/guanylate cyclase domain-containing protein [Spirochaetales bacterium]